MIVVVSQAWTRDTEAAATGYLAASAELLAFMRTQPGFRGRQLLRSLDQPTHFTHLRWFETAEAYHRMTAQPGYAQHIQALSQFLDLDHYTSSPRELLRVVLDDSVLVQPQC